MHHTLPLCFLYSLDMYVRLLSFLGIWSIFFFKTRIMRTLPFMQTHIDDPNENKYNLWTLFSTRAGGINRLVSEPLIISLLSDSDIGLNLDNDSCKLIHKMHLVHMMYSHYKLSFFHKKKNVFGNDLLGRYVMVEDVLLFGHKIFALLSLNIPYLHFCWIADSSIWLGPDLVNRTLISTHHSGKYLIAIIIHFNKTKPYTAWSTCVVSHMKSLFIDKTKECFIIYI